jgi:hypothetical protein
MSRVHHLPLRDVTADTDNTASSIAACWNVFTELLPGNALMKSVTIYSARPKHIHIIVLILKNKNGL